MRVFALFVALTAVHASAAEIQAPATERVVFHTVAGDLVFALFPNAAPQTVKQFLALARAGVYDTTTFARIHPGFVAQVSTAQDRQRPLTAEQTALIHRLPLEASALRHTRGLLSMARPDGDPNGAETSFCILLGPAPQLDDKYTVFGRLESGDDVLTELLRVPRNGDLQPSVRLTVESAQVFDSPAALAKVPLVPAHPVPGAADLAAATASGPREVVLGVGLLLVVLLAAAGALLRQRISPRVIAALNLIVLLVGVFLLLVLVVPEPQRPAWLSTLLFFGLVGVFRALGRFEPAER